MTRSLTPSNVSAEPKRPLVVRVAPLIVPVLPRPEASDTVVPLGSLKPQAPTGAPPAGGAGLTVSVTATVFGEPVVPADVTVIVPV